jgi:GAF domain-containing protein
MFNQARQRLRAPVFEEDQDKTRIASLLNTVLLSALAVAVLAIFFLPLVQDPLNGTVVVAVWMVISISALVLLRAGYVRFAGGLLTLVMWVFVTGIILFSGGVGRSSVASYVTITILASLLLGSRAAIAVAGVNIVAALGFLYVQLNGLLPPPTFNISPVGELIGLIANIGMAGVLLYLSAQGIAEALGRARRYAAELEQQRGRLEETVEARTHDLIRRTRYLEATSIIAQEAAGMLDVEALLTRVATSISEQLGFYHTGIFLVDFDGEWAVLQAASSEGGKRMVARGHRLRVGEMGIVGYVTGNNQPRVALDVGEDAVFFDNPDLPETRSEMALPLRARGEVIGALDVQSREQGAFSDEDVAVLQTLADQVAMAISNARLFQQAQESLEAERRAYGELRREAWRDLLRVEPDLGFVRNQTGLLPAGDVWRPEMEAAIESGTTATSGDGTEEGQTMAVPIKVGDHVIGVVDVHRRGAAREWSAEEMQLMETLSAQLGVALESARLYRDTQRRAARERLLGDITTRVRETLDMDTVLQTAIREIGQALDLAEVEVRMSTTPSHMVSRPHAGAGNEEEDL